MSANNNKSKNSINPIKTKKSIQVSKDSYSIQILPPTSEKEQNNSFQWLSIDLLEQKNPKKVRKSSSCTKSGDFDFGKMSTFYSEKIIEKNSKENFQVFNDEEIRTIPIIKEMDVKFIVGFLNQKIAKKEF